MTKRILLLEEVQDIEGRALIVSDEEGAPEGVATPARHGGHNYWHGYLDRHQVADYGGKLEAFASSAELVPELPTSRWGRSFESVKTPEQEAFVRDLLAVCRHHGFVLGHEDCHGAFTFAPRSARTPEEIKADEEWLAHMHEEA